LEEIDIDKDRIRDIIKVYGFKNHAFIFGVSCISVIDLQTFNIIKTINIKNIWGLEIVLNIIEMKNIYYICKYKDDKIILRTLIIN
jgi:hypothetical protein